MSTLGVGAELEQLAHYLAQRETDGTAVPMPPTDAPVPGLAPVLAHAVHVSRASIVVTDADLDEPGPRILYANPAFEQMTGYRAADIVGRNPRFLQGHHTDRRVLDRLRTDLAASGTFEGETLNYRADGTPFVMSWRIAAVPGPDGEPSHYVAIQDDVSEARSRELRDHHVVGQLQASLLPDIPDQVGPLRVAARYCPAESGLAVGGDWYDAVAMSGGATGLVVGDVAGHGLRAAALMGRLRWTTSTLLATGSSAAQSLTALRSVLVHEPAFATVAIVVVRSDGELEVVTAGHPSVVIRRADGSVSLVRTPNAMLGLVARRSVGHHDRLGPGDEIAICTDGLIERRDITLDEASRALADELVRGTEVDDLQRRCDGVVDALLERPQRDDAALVLARFQPG